MVAVVLAGIAAPLAVTRNFYYWDDTAGAAVGVWQRIGGQVLAGHFPVLETDMWRGGNFAAEAATGMWNPVMVGLMVITHPLDNIALAITVAKAALFVILALGLYVLTREYGAGRWPAALVGTAMALSGYTLYMDGTSWINGLAITAFTPWLWWAARRHLEGRGSILWSVLAGYLLVSTGNPYGMLAFGGVMGALGVEMVIRGKARKLWWIAAQIVVGLLVAVIIYLPFLMTSSIGNRAQSATHNDEFMAPGLSDLLGMSTPGFQPYIQMFGAPYMTFPGLYLGWFVLPLAPWLRWRRLGEAWRVWSGAAAFGLFYLLLVLGPSQIWMFRWPARLLPFLTLAIFVILARALTGGLQRDHRGARWAVSSGLIVMGAWQAYSDRPEHSTWAILSAVGVGLLTAVFLRVRSVRGRGYAVGAVGLLGVLALQLYWMPSNASVTNYDFPATRSQMQENFGGRYEGLTIQVADLFKLPRDATEPEGAWRDILFGNTYSVSGVESTTAYTGIGFTTHDSALCLNYFGATCRDAWFTLWEKPKGEDVPLVDMLGARTVVVQKTLVASPQTPEGWEKTEETRYVNVFRRTAPLSFPEGRVSTYGRAVEVSADMGRGTSETVAVSSGVGSVHDRTLTFSRLAWPGYAVTLDGAELEPVVGSAGLLQVVLPENVKSGELAVGFTPPGWELGLTCLGVATLIAIALSVFDHVRRRRRNSTKGVE